MKNKVPEEVSQMYNKVKDDVLEDVDEIVVEFLKIVNNLDKSSRDAFEEKFNTMEDSISNLKTDIENEHFVMLGNP